MSLPSLPTGWSWSLMSEVASWGSGGTPSRSKQEYYGGDIPWIKTGELNDSYILDTSEKLTEIGLKNSSAKMYPKGSIAIAMYGATIGKLGILGINASCNQACAIAIPYEYLDNIYLFYYLKSSKNAFTNRGQGGAQPNISQEILKSFPIPIPPLKIQKKIVSILVEADMLIQKRKMAIAKLDELIQSVFIEMFGDPVSNPKKWAVKKIGNLSDSTQYGTSKKANERAGSFPILRMNNITYQGTWDFTSLKYIDLDEKEQKKYLVHKDELLFNRTNSKELVGKTAVYRENKPIAFAGYLIKLKTNEEADPYFISTYLNSKYGKSILYSMAKNIVGMANINAEELKSIKIYAPPIDLQKKFAEIFNEIEEQKKQMEVQLLKLEENFQSLLHQAFTGQLQFNETKVNDYAIKR